MASFFRTEDLPVQRLSITPSARDRETCDEVRPFASNYCPTIRFIASASLMSRLVSPSASWVVRTTSTFL